MGSLGITNGSYACIVKWVSTYRDGLESPFTEEDGQISPDGRWLSYTSNESGHNEVCVGSFPEARAKYQISNGGGTGVHWSPSGRELFYRDENATLLSVPVQIGTGFEPGAPKPLFRIPPGTVSLIPTPDGKRFLISTLDESTEQSALEVILNWSELLAKKN